MTKTHPFVFSRLQTTAWPVIWRSFFLGILAAWFSCSIVSSSQGQEASESIDGKSSQINEASQPETALFAGGCFWSLESDFEKLPGVVEVLSGYTGGRSKNPTYQTYATGGHREAILVGYDPKKVTYAGLVEFFLKHIDPTDRTGSFIDRGKQYSSAIYYQNDEEKKEAERVIVAFDKLKIYKQKINVPLVERKIFWPAEAYHQDYAKRNSGSYMNYRATCGRDPFIVSVWGENANRLQLPGSIPKASESTSKAGQEQGKEVASNESKKAAWEEFKKPPRKELHKMLNNMQFRVTQTNFTEPAFQNSFWNHHAEGIYVDIVSGEPLFCSLQKFDSGTGWPSFVRPIHGELITYLEDRSEGDIRTEVRSKIADSHLGHVFNDGPPAFGGLRYCINSASLRFIPKAELKKQGYEDYLKLFEEETVTADPPSSTPKTENRTRPK